MLIDFRERERKGEGEGEKLRCEKNIDQLPLVRTLAGDGTRSLGMCPDWELSPWPFGLWDNAPTNWDPQARAPLVFLILHRVQVLWGPLLKV